MEKLQFSIVVLGAHNPAIHYPLWYSSIAGAIDSEEYNAAMNEGVVICTPEVSQFNFGQTAVTCTRQFWKVVSEGTKDRALRLATHVFERLRDTPITRYGINLDYTLPPTWRDLSTLAIAPGLLPGSVCQVESRAATPLGGEHWARLCFAKGQRSLLNNFDYAPPKVQHEFDLRPLLDARVPEAELLASMTRQQVEVTLTSEASA
jgi:hypothetical protein